MRGQIYILFLVALLFVACGPATREAPSETEVAGTPESAETTETPVTPVTAETQGTEQQTGSPEAEAPTGPPEDFADQDYTTTDSGLQFAVVDEGDGEKPKSGEVVRVHYTGKLGDGTVFDSSEGRDPHRFVLGQGNVIRGWDEGIALLNEGSKAKLIIPPELGYGESGSGAIPPNATLYFDVELVEILPGGPAEPEAVDEGDYTETDSGLKYHVLAESDGPSPEEGQPVRVHYTAWLEDGTRIDSSIDRGEPIVFAVGSEQVFPGWNEAVKAMSVGDKWQVIIPPELALGEEGAGDLIPPDSTLIMQIELLEVLPEGPSEPSEVEEDAYTTTESGLKYYDVVEGDGEVVEAGDTVTLHYTAWLTDGTKFDSSYQRGEPVSLPIGAGQALPGWDEGVLGTKEGTTRQLVIPPELAFGEQGVGNVVPPNATLIFEVEILEVEKSAN